MALPQDTALALFAKAPRAGHVKTRLQGLLSDAGAAEFHRLCVLDAWERIAGWDGVEPLLYCDSPWQEFESLAGRDRFRLQRGEDLGERMRNCLDELLATGRAKGLIVGSDAPTLPRAQVTEALDCLEHSNAVLGPCADGGFTLLGATRTDPEMFRDVEWSSDATRRETLEALGRAGLSAVETPTWAYDVDTPADLDRLQRDPDLPARLRKWFDQRADLPLGDASTADRGCSQGGP